MFQFVEYHFFNNEAYKYKYDNPTYNITYKYDNLYDTMKKKFIDVLIYYFEYEIADDMISLECKGASFFRQMSLPNI